MTDIFVCSDGHVCTSDCRRTGCLCWEDHTHPERGDQWICDRGCTTDKQQRSEKYPHLCKRCEKEIDNEN